MNLLNRIHIEEYRDDNLVKAKDSIHSYSFIVSFLYSPLPEENKWDEYEILDFLNKHSHLSMRFKIIKFHDHKALHINKEGSAFIFIKSIYDAEEGHNKKDCDKILLLLLKDYLESELKERKESFMDGVLATYASNPIIKSRINPSFLNPIVTWSDPMWPKDETVYFDRVESRPEEEKDNNDICDSMAYGLQLHTEFAKNNVEDDLVIQEYKECLKELYNNKERGET